MMKLGSHMSTAGGAWKAIERARSVDCESTQIFVKSNMQWFGKPPKPADAERFAIELAKGDVGTVFGHAGYLINLAAPDPTLRDRSIAALTDELDRADALGLLGVVLHPGSYTTGTEADGLRLVTEAIDAIFSTRVAGTKLLLEHTAGQGTNLGHRFEHLATIIDGASARDRLGVCLDTCHLLAAGYDIALEQGYADTFDAFESLIGLDRLHLLHLNDSKFACGSRRDRHDHIGRGWVGLKTFARLLGDPRLAGLPMVLETPKDNRQNPAATTPDPADLRNLQALRDLMG